MDEDTPKKVAVIGFDGATPKRILKYVSEGVLPNFARVIGNGVIAENGLVPLPTITPPNWTTLATGAWPGTHGITDYHIPIPSNAIDMQSCRPAYSRNFYEAENIWEAAERVGKKSIVFNWPASWPSRLKNGIVVGGGANIIGQWEYSDKPGPDSRFSFFQLGVDHIFSTILYPKGGNKVEFSDAEGWQNLPEPKKGSREPLEAEATLTWELSSHDIPPTQWHFLVRDSQGRGYDEATLSPTKNFKDAFCTLKVGQWSNRLTSDVKTRQGEVHSCIFRAKLVELSEDASAFRLYTTGLADTDGFTSPPEVAREIVANCPGGDLGLRGGGLRAFQYGWVEIDTFLETLEMQHEFLAEAMEYLLKNKEWNLFFVQIHSPDWVGHSFLSLADPIHTKDKAENAKYQEAEKQVWMSLDRMLGRILATMEKDTLVALVSDHGSVASGDPLPLFNALVEKGLLVFEGDVKDFGEITGGETGFAPLFQLKIDWSRTRAVPQRTTHIYVNLKGRNPKGIVEPQDYEKVRQEIIDALMTYVDPKTGKRPFAFALRKEDARPWGTYGDKVGDVIRADYAGFGGQHGAFLATSDHGFSSLKGLFVLSGPGIRKGEILKRTVWITDLVPTICYLMDLPFPDKVEGAVIYQALKDPDFKQKELKKLKDTLSSMEKDLSGQAH